MTQPAEELETADTTRFSLRMTPALLEAVDARAKETGRSRNEWMNRALGFVLAELPRDASPEQRLALRARFEAGDL